MRLTSMPHEADRTTRGLASSMRVASSCPANPPKTTEWIAPMRAQGQHRERRLGHHRHIDQHAVALDDAEACQHAGQTRDLVAQFQIGEMPDLPGDRAVLDQRDPLATTRRDMAVSAQDRNDTRRAK